MYYHTNVTKVRLDMREYQSNSPDQTIDFAKQFAQTLSGGEVIAIDGDLGAGKTAFVKGIALGLGIQKNVSSPTFNIVREYEGRLRLFHFDVYRIADPAELFEIGFEEYLSAGGVCAIEWAEMIEDQLPPDALHIRISGDGAARRILISGGEARTI